MLIGLAASALYFPSGLDSLPHKDMDLNGGYAAFKLRVDPNALTLAISPDKHCITWDDSETIGYTSIKRVQPDSKVCIDYYGNIVEGERMPGPLVVNADEVTLNMDPRKL